MNVWKLGRFLTPLYFAGLILVYVGCHPVQGQTGCSLIDSGKPVFSITFESVVVETKERNVRLRLYNNSTCPIYFGTWDEPDQRSADPDAATGFKPSSIVELADGSISRVWYWVYHTGSNELMGKTYGDMVNLAILRSGRVVRFDVPLKYFKNDGTLKIDYQYEWERGHNAQEQFMTIHNQISFFASFIPATVKK